MKANHRAQRKKKLRQSILDAAADILQTQGMEMLTMRAIADRVLHSASSLYEHFPHKEAICEELAYGLLRDLEVTLRALPTDRTPEQHLMDIALSMHGFARDNWKRYVLSLQLRLPTKKQEIIAIRAVMADAIAALNYPHLKDPTNHARALEIVRTCIEGASLLGCRTQSHSATAARISNCHADVLASVWISGVNGHGQCALSLCSTHHHD